MKLFKDILIATSLVLVFTASILFLADTSITAAFANIWRGAFGSTMKFSQVLAVWVPLLLCSCGLLFTFRANLWNIGIEGQMIMGAIGGYAILRLPGIGSPTLLLTLAFITAMLTGACWGLLAGLLKTRGGVHEIFGGLGMNFVAQGFIIWLIFGPWKRPGIASMSGTALLAHDLWLASPSGLRVSYIGLLLACLILLLSWLLLYKSKLGLQLRAIGQNPRAAMLYCISNERYYLLSIIIGGALAGLAGCIQTTAVYHRLIPSISSGYGYLSLLLVMLAGYRIYPIPLLALFFGGLNVGAIQLPIVLQVDSTLSGVIQGGCVLSTLFVLGLRQRRRKSC